MSAPAPRSPGGVARLLETAAGLMIVEATHEGIARLQQVDAADLHAADLHLAELDPAEPDDAGRGVGVDDVAAGAKAHLVRLAEQLEDYLAGTAREFDVPLDWAAAGVHDEFSREVYREIQHIPYGETSTYGQISMDAGRPRNARRVGRLCSLVPVPFVIPVHRVIRADGGMGNCPEYRLRLLHHERRNLEAARIGSPAAPFA
ncbi:methylated-DNA--[protein]-cysteine S-methyltransferase [Dietzia sp. ANT_WB102]|uniref:methylated-DNA--[protein]-cysteine S-methyltransferase n=1 Tax=Dietzia sp. ANT_WB102 TaxID=2597345 RepID=UPI0011EC3D3F|nr:methylated-DNA--[protein]-cysteine S-methyltransferase [Dietzia sp. ANT_WB102]KAA0918768.1 methylated-DNA--[protein]-cysteine S-methyltransferase [Dietzia sp. ANT_WB102]